MRYTIALIFLVVLTFGCARNNVKTQLLSEQKSLKDCVNTAYDRIGVYDRNGSHDSAEAEKKHISGLHKRLTDIQHSLDSLEKAK